MKDAEALDLALRLLNADTEDEVITILRHAGFWDDARVWRLYGDRDGNFATIGNQQSRPEAALVEKIVNSVDARLMDECLKRGTDPSSAGAPQSIRHAVSRFIEGRELEGDTGGTVQSWDQERQLEESQRITLAITGAKARNGNPSLTIADEGEGQTPNQMPETFLSIDRANKLRIPFVQGKFNMGGTGALKFCGRHSLQLIISRRNPEIVRQLESNDGSASLWGFTVIRRERPSGGTGSVRNSVFKYLAPTDASARPGLGQLLSFGAMQLPLMPKDNRPYEREIDHGSVVKLYEYDMKGFKSHALMKGGLLSRLEILLPEIALPVRLHECRQYRGDEARSFANSMVGLSARLSRNRADNLEVGYPTSVQLTVRGEQMLAQIFAFKGDKAESYRTNEGIIFTVNGQTHGSIPKTFFERSSVKMGRLAKSLLVVVDCSRLSVGAREDLFMNSRDRLSNGELRKAIEEELEDLIGRHPGLRELRERRRSEEIAERLEDSKPLEDVLKAILRSSPTLARLFLLGQRLSRPHRIDPNTGDESGGHSGGGAFIGRPHPTYFRFHRKRSGELLQRTSEAGRRCRIKYETDAANDYFSRSSLPGRYNVEVIEGDVEGSDLDHNLTLHNGIANWSISLPEDRLGLGDELVVQCSVTDDTLLEPLVNVARARVVARTDRPPSAPGKPDEGVGDEGEDEDGSGGQGANGDSRNRSGRGQPGGLALPEIKKIRQAQWQPNGFDEQSACKIVDDGTGDPQDKRSAYVFYINVDNKYLRADMKDGDSDVALKEARFVYSNVLVGLALIHDHKSTVSRGRKTESEPDQDLQTVEETVQSTTRALAPFLVPMIDFLGSLSADEVVSLAQVGDET